MLFTAGKHLKWDVLQTSASDCVGGWGVYCLFKQLAFCFKLSQCTHQMPALRYISTHKWFPTIISEQAVKFSERWLVFILRTVV